MMNSFNFKVRVMRVCSPKDWLSTWAAIYDRDENTYEGTYAELIAKDPPFTAEDFTKIGRWKDNAWTENKWKPNVAQVAYIVWAQAAKELPSCPHDSTVREFVNEWSARSYTDQYANGSRTKCFGPPRATTLLHFLSGARYPIFDSRVRTAMARLLDPPVRIPNTVEAYFDQYIPLFGQLAALCESNDFRTIDKALFSYGALPDEMFRR